MDLKSSEDKIVESFENYLRVKFLNFKNENQLGKKFKSYNKDLNEQFKSKIDDLNYPIDETYRLLQLYEPSEILIFNDNY